MKITRFALVMLLVSAFSLSLFAQDSTKTAPKTKPASHKVVKSPKKAATGTKTTKTTAKGTKGKKKDTEAKKDTLKTAY